MKHFLMLALTISSSCGTLRSDLKPAPAFSKEKVCSPKALEYLNKNRRGKALSAEQFQAAGVEVVTKLDAPTKNCYQTELYRNDNLQPFNLCLILGTDAQGKIDFFDFHTTEIKVSDEFYQCLNESIKTLDLSRFKFLNMLQPFQISTTQE